MYIYIVQCTRNLRVTYTLIDAQGKYALTTFISCLDSSFSLTSVSVMNLCCIIYTTHYFPEMFILLLCLRAKAWNVVIALSVLLQMCVFLFVIVTFFIFFRMLFYLWLLFPGGLRAEPGEKCDAWQVWCCAWWCAWCDGASSLKYVVKDKFKMDSLQMTNLKVPIKRFSPKQFPLFLRSAIFGKLVMMLPWPSQWTIRWTSSFSTY